MYTISCKFPLAFSRGFYLIRPCAAYPWPFPAGSAAGYRPPLGFRSKKPVICAAFWPTDDRLLSPGTPRRRLFLYILLAVSGYAGIHYLLFPSRKKGCPSIFSCVLSTVPSPSARMKPVRKACRSSLSEHPPAPGSPLHPAPEGTAVFLAAARRGILRFLFRAAARG